jgi:SAM-dependent methyltransferase
LDWYSWKANELISILEKNKLNIFTNNIKILELGSGPVGIISYLNIGNKFSIDPLENYYCKIPELIQLRNNNVTYLQGFGESIPFNNNEFSLVIIDNVIDHTRKPGLVLKEIRRVLKEDGILYLSVNVHTSYGASLHEILNIINIDVKHPHTYTLDKIRDLLASEGFKIIYEEVEKYETAKKMNTSSGDYKIRMKGYLGLSEMLYKSNSMTTLLY